MSSHSTPHPKTPRTLTMLALVLLVAGLAGWWFGIEQPRREQQRRERAEADGPSSQPTDEDKRKADEAERQRLATEAEKQRMAAEAAKVATVTDALRDAAAALDRKNFAEAHERYQAALAIDAANAEAKSGLAAVKDAEYAEQQRLAMERQKAAEERKRLDEEVKKTADRATPLATPPPIEVARLNTPKPLLPTSAPSAPQPPVDAARVKDEKVAGGDLKIKSDPAGASVSREGKSLGTTPLTLKNYPPGSYLFTLRKSGYRSTTAKVVVSATGNNEVTSKLERQSSFAGTWTGTAEETGVRVPIRPWRVVVRIPPDEDKVETELGEGPGNTRRSACHRNGDTLSWRINELPAIEVFRSVDQKCDITLTLIGKGLAKCILKRNHKVPWSDGPSIATLRKK